MVREDNNIIVSSKFIGTRGYAAPELLLDVEEEKVVNGKNIDVWALGITLWEMLEKKHPFNVKTLEDLQKHLSRE